MPNEGHTTDDTDPRIKSLVIRFLREMGPTTPDALERVVFEHLTGHTREEVDWDVEDNQAGYHLWIRSFDEMLEELAQAGYLKVEGDRDSGTVTLSSGDMIAAIDLSPDEPWEA